MIQPIDHAVRRLYQELLDCWNTRDAEAMAALFAEPCTVIGFDGSQMRGRAEITSEIGRIFRDHETAAYVGIVRDVHPLGANVAVLTAVAGMIPPGASDINPATNAVQSMVAVRVDDAWRIALYQNTPAAFHGRAELAETLTHELRAAALAIARALQH